ncbi:hypothetical protein ANN_07896 [Periplaneta americana]|uniref:Uncharacterized protein n=1 Tax=Periplaneta americana TaxID=6978 RepID=A0ABQ8SZV9_PERAM|nr:hypothetical protein ANN_07896 [Periplaneta americana]
MAGLCDGGNEPPGFLKKPARRAEIAFPDDRTNNQQTREEADSKLTLVLAEGNSFNCTKTGLNLSSNTNKASLMRQLSQELMG